MLRFRLGISICLMLFLCNVSFAKPLSELKKQYSQATIYYAHWDIDTTTPWGADAVRRNASAVIKIDGEEQLKPLLALLDLPSVSQKASQAGDARVVFDLKVIRGETVTYYADQFGLYNGDSTLYRSIDKTFPNNLKSILVSVF